MSLDSIQKHRYEKNKNHAFFSTAFGFLFALLLSAHAGAQGNNLIEISGNVMQQETKQPLEGVSVQIKGTVSGTITDKNGNFKLRAKNKFPVYAGVFFIRFSAAGV